jgi:hypothetical protein|tara:strand:- start:918 stop:1631 length:714 start_codon:yes stop_codon:yes gene_type:complete
MSMEIEWVGVDPGRAEIGSQNRSILFGDAGPRHMVELKYDFEISKTPVHIDEAKTLLESNDCEVASESEWQLAFEQGAVEGSDELEKLSDRFRGDYWGKELDGRPISLEDWTFRIAKKWKDGVPKTCLINSQQSEPEYVRLKRFEQLSERDTNPPRLPSQRDTAKLIREEVLVVIIAGVTPSFIWAYFNATEGYIQTGWPGLILGGIILGLATGIFWRPKTTSYRIGRNCGKVKPNN